MADEHFWQDLGGGLMGHHQISEELRWAASGETRIVGFTKPYSGFKKNAGDTVSMYHVLPMADVADGSIQEAGEIPMRMMAFGRRDLTLTEHGSATTFTHKLETLFKFNIPDTMKKGLQQHLAETMDNEATNLGFLSTDVKIVATPTNLTDLSFSTTGTATAVAAAPMTKEHVKKISTYMWDTIHVPFYDRPISKTHQIGNQGEGGSDHYICLSSGDNIENLLLDPDVIRWQQAMRRGEMLYRNEACDLHNVRFVRINRQNAFSDAIDAGGLIGDACFFGDEAIAFVEAEAPSLRLAPDWGGKGGLVQAMLWYGIYTFGPYWNFSDDGRAKMVKWGSL